MTWDSAQALGGEHPADATPGGADDLCTIMYTSGTTGDPKGVEITHRAVLATVGALSRLLTEMKLALGCATPGHRRVRRTNAQHVHPRAGCACGPSWTLQRVATRVRAPMQAGGRLSLVPAPRAHL